MDETPKTLENLFSQLGLKSDEQSIETFIADHPLAEGVKLVEAPFWSPSHPRRLNENLLDAGPWARVGADLNVRLHTLR